MSVNAIFYKGPSLAEKTKEAVAGSLTYQAGQLARQSDTGWVPCSDDDTQFNGIMGTTEAVATTAGDKKWVHRITSPDQMFVMNVTNAGTDTKAPASLIGNKYGYEVNSCIGTVNINNDTGGEIYVYGRLCDKEPYLTLSSAVPGKVICGFTAASLTAEQ